MLSRIGTSQLHLSTCGRRLKVRVFLLSRLREIGRSRKQKDVVMVLALCDVTVGHCSGVDLAGLVVGGWWLELLWLAVAGGLRHEEVVVRPGGVPGANCGRLHLISISRPHKTS